MRNKFGWDLPPGVRHSDIPGNRPEDVAAEKFHEEVADRIPLLFEDFASIVQKVHSEMSGSTEDLQSALIELVNFCDTHDIDLGEMAAPLEEAGTYSPPDPGDYGDYLYDRAKDEGRV